VPEQLAELSPAKSEQEREEQLQSAMQTLPELHRTALALRYFENMDYAAIEQTLGLSNGALRGILGRALGTLRKQLKPRLASTIT
jgi:RNA polymerase sigma factor (sigma-70 family)